MINTSGPAQEEEPARPSVIETALRYLENLEQSDVMIQDPAEKKAKLRVVTSTLFKILANIISSPMEPKFRKLPRNSNTSNKLVQQHKRTISVSPMLDYLD